MARTEPTPNAVRHSPAARTPAELEKKRKQDQRLDEELEQTFPASDPIPSHYDVHKTQ